MAHTQFSLLGVRRFLPLFVTQALGAFNDNAFRNALVVLITYSLADKAGIDGSTFITVAGGIFILPFLLFSATAGQLADKFEKSRLIRFIKLCEIGLMALAAIGFYLENVYWLLGVLFLMATQSAFFGPIKYSILPQHLKEDELVGGNALIETGTFLAILFGLLFGGLLVLSNAGSVVVSASLIGLAALGYVSSCFVPRAEPPSPDLKLNLNPITETVAIVRHAAGQRDVFLSILGTSWFWLVGFVFLTEFPTYTKDVLGANEQVNILFIATFSIGIGIGSLLCNRLLKSQISAKYVPLAAIAITIFSVDLVIASNQAVVNSGELIGVTAFLAETANWRLLFDMVMIAVCGGIYAVPLFAIIQSRSDAEHRSRTIAANNILNALFMVTAAAVMVGMLKLGSSIPDIFLAVALANAGVALYICKLLPDETVKSIGRLLFRLLHRVEVKGWENYHAVGDRVVIVANHTSLLDAPVLGSFLPETPVFGINTQVADKWWVKPAYLMFDLLPLDPTNPMAIRALVQRVKEGGKCVIFPEGRLTMTGGLMKVYEGPGAIADMADATILPIRIDGAQYSFFSRLRGVLRLRLFPKITVTIMPPERIELDDEIKGAKRREIIGTKLYDVMANMVFETSNRRQTLFEGLLDARAVHGGSQAVIEDVERNPMSYNRLVLGSFVLGRRIATRTDRGEHVGILLPNAAGAVASFFALHANGRVPAMLNYSTGFLNMVSACQTARIKTVLTSRRFIELARLDEAAAELSKVATLVYLEDIRTEIGLIDKLFGLIARQFAGLAYKRLSGAPEPDDTAVVLFTSGSEGVPKGVALSHANLQANRYQLSARVDFNPADQVFNALPIFHSFGLTGGLLLPLLSGIKTFLYPSPLHYRIVPEFVYGTNSTIMFGTDTFLAGYGRSSHPYDFYSVRYVFAGAEKVKPETRQMWIDKFGLRILEGYGATETSPVLSTNTPMQFKAGTVGRFLPGLSHRIEPVPGIEHGGRLEVSGPNIMKGYLLADRPGELVPPEGGWYDTGDIVTVDADGYVTIQGRAKRFAKIGGEMVSLSAVEAHVSELWPDFAHAVVSIPDRRKGEQLVLVTENHDADRKYISEHGRNKGLSELMIPRNIAMVDKLPVLGTGKVDYLTIQEIALADFGEAEAPELEEAAE